MEVRSDDALNHLLKLNPFKFQKLTKYALLYSSVIVMTISREFFAIAAVVWWIYIGAGR